MRLLRSLLNATAVDGAESPRHAGFAEAGAAEPIRVAILVDLGFDPLTLGAFCSVLGAEATGGGYHIHFVSPGGGRVSGRGGLTIETRAPEAPVRDRPDILLLLGGADREANERHLGHVGEWLRAFREHRIRTYALGDGRRFVPSPLGVSPEGDGEARRAPVAENEGGVWFSPGSAAALDVALLIVEEDHGASAAFAIAASLHLQSRRFAREPSVGRTLRLQAKAGARFSPLLDAVRSNPAMRADVESLAELSGMSLRTFARRFKRETGLAPAAAVEQIRVELAEALVSAGGASLKEVALRTGFGTEARLRSALRRSGSALPRAG